jgi:hypothetical protein
MVTAAEAANIDTILEYCGFTTQAHRTSIAADGFESYADMLSLTEKDIGALAKGFAERTANQGRVIFGLRRTNHLKASIHWAQDFRRISRLVTLDHTADAAEFRTQIETARQRAQIRKHNAEESDSLSKAADPGKLKRQKEWIAWSRGLGNYLSTILGQDGVPLSYIIRENDAPDYTLESQPDFDYEQLSIDCAALNGLVFKTDARKVHQLIHGFVQGETAETWIKPKEKRQNGRLDFQALQAHYGGEGNKSVRIKEAEVLRTSLNYKNERAMSFEKFLTSMQAMFTGFEDNDEILTNAQKIRLLFQKVQSPNLTQVKSALKVQSDLDVGGLTVTYDFIANSLAAEAASLPDYVPNRQASGLDSHGGKGSSPESGVKGPDGTIFTGYYKNWNSISDDDKHAVYEERKRLGVVPKKARRSKPSSIKTKKKTLAKMTREIASLKTKFNNLKKKRGASSDDDADGADEPQDNAGDQFGGRKDKKKKRGDSQ